MKSKPASHHSLYSEGRGSTVISTIACPVCDIPTEQLAIPRRHDLGLRQCSSCKLIYRAGPLSDAEISTIYGDNYYDHWRIERGFNDVWNMKVKTSLAYVDILVRHLPQSLSSPKMLDIGCAHGFMLEAAQQQGFQVFGIEISPAADVAREKGFTVYDRSLHELDLSADSFDAITMIDVIEHILDPRGFLQQAYRILKPQGLLFIVTPNVESWIAKMMKDSWPHYLVEHILYFGPSSLSTLLRRTKFRVELIRRGFKYLNFEYILGHFQKSNPGWMTPAFSSLFAALPKTITRTLLRLPTEMLAIARKE